MDYLGDMPVVLSVSRLAQPLAEAPGAVTVINREMIHASGFREIPDLLRLVPGFYVGWYDGTMATVNRGLPDQYSRRMQVLVDGRSIYTPLFGGVQWSDLPLAMDDIERIEVIRGRMRPVTVPMLSWYYQYHHAASGRGSWNAFFWELR